MIPTNDNNKLARWSFDQQTMNTLWEHWMSRWFADVSKGWEIDLHKLKPYVRKPSNNDNGR